MTDKYQYIIDKRNERDIREQISKLAASYTPEWNFTDKNPDIGSVIGLIFAGQMADNVKRYNASLERFRIELADMLGISLKPAKAAQSVVIMRAGRNGLSGLPVEKGTKLTAQTDAGEELIFETMHDIYVTGADITDIAGILEDTGQVYAYRGEMKRMPVLAELASDMPEEGLEEGQPGIWQQALILYHDYLFDRQGEEVRIRFLGKQGGVLSAGMFADPSKYRFLYYTCSGLQEVEEVRCEQDCIVLRRDKPSRRVAGDGKEYAAVILKQLVPGEEIVISGIALLGDDSRAPADYISDGTSGLEAAEFYPFGQELSVYQECYIGQDKVFSKKGAQITLTFELSFEEIRYTYEKEKDHKNSGAGNDTDNKKLPVIRRKPKYQVDETVYSCAADETVFEYFNGTGWRRLAVPVGAGRIFADGKNAGKQEIVFRAPDDWKETREGGYEGRCLRIRIVRADQCFLRPCVHKVPVIRGLEAGFSYEGEYMAPDRVVRLSGTEYTELTDYLRKAEECSAFRTFPYMGNGLYLGLSGRPEQGPVSLYVKLRDKSRPPEGNAYWEYSTGSGFKPLRVMDHTGNLSDSGTVMFEPPLDMGLQKVEGVTRYWLRIVDRNGRMEGLGSCPGLIEDILPNAVMVHNVETSKPEDYYIDTVHAGMSFPLYGENILDAEVWVNEKEELSSGQMEALAKEMPDRVRAEYNYLGEIQEFYVRWEETESFGTVGGMDRSYQIDRVNNRIVFGDGIHTRIPRNTTETAFCIKRKSCKGSLGNIAAGSITGFRGKMMSVEELYNPVPGYGGSDLESLERALLRGSNLLSSRGRLVSETDYVREALYFSGNVAQAACVCGRDRSGRKRDGLISLIILMKDYKDGNSSFRRFKEEFRRHLAGRCELSCREPDIRIEEPVFIHVSIELWLYVPDMAEGYAVRKELLRKIEDYLEPGISPEQGWQIGNLPGEEQISMLLHTLEKKCRIEKYSITAYLLDHKGIHEMPLHKAAGNPFAIGVNGEHHINMNGGIPLAES